MGEAKLTYSVAEYFEIDNDKQEVRYQLYNGEIFAMAGANARYNELCGNIYTKLRSQIKGKGCKVFMESMRLANVSEQNYYYPDVLMTCNPLETQQPTLKIVKTPSLIVEVLSDSTAHFDANEKLLEYIQIPSLQYYLIISQHKISVTCYAKTDLGWLVKGYENIEEVISLNNLQLEISLADIYENIDF